MRQRIITGGVAVVAAFAFAACSSTAGPTSAASNGAAASAAPSLLVPSITLPSGLPSVALPSPDAALEAVIPDQLCGTATIKSSAAGGAFAEGDAQIQAFLQSLGKTSADVSFAAGIAGTTGCGVTVVQVKGASGAQMHDQFVAAATQQGTAPEEKSIGGKSVLVGKDPNSFGYAYFKDDKVIFFTAPDDTKAAEIATALP